jgi:hypothetical protein
MSGFRADLERRRAAQGDLRNPFYATADRPVELVVETTNGETWLLPWHHFVFGRHQEAGERERLVLTFVAHEVAISGSNLGALITEVVDQRLARLRAAPGKYLKSSGEEPFIEQVQVRSLAEHTVTE